MGRTSSVKDKALEALFQNKKIIFINSDLLQVSSTGGINDLLYNLARKQVVFKLKRGHYLFPGVLEEAFNRPGFLDFYLTHQFDDCYLGGMQGIRYFFNQEAPVKVMTSSMGQGLSFDYKETGFRFEKPLFSNIDQDVISLRIEGINFRIASPVLTFFESACTASDTESLELLARYCRAREYSIRENFPRFLQSVPVPAECLQAVQQLLSGPALSDLFHVERKVLGELLHKGKRPVGHGKGSKEFGEVFDDRDKFLPFSPGRKSRKLPWKDREGWDFGTGTLMVFAPPGYMRREFLGTLFEQSKDEFKFWYTIDFSDRDLRSFFRHLVLLVSERFPLILGEYHKMIHFLPADEEMASELLLKFIKNIFKKYFLHQRIHITFDMFDKVRKSVTRRFILRLIALEGVQISGVIGADSRFYIGQDLQAGKDFLFYGIDRMLLTEQEISDYFLERKKISLNPDEAAAVKRLTWGIPLFADFITSSALLSSGVTRDLPELIRANQDIYSFSTEEVFRKMNSEIKRSIMMVLSAIEQLEYTVLNDFLNWVGIHSDTTEFFSLCYGYIRISGGIVEINPLVANSIRKYVTNAFGIKYMKLLEKMAEFFEYKRDFRNLCIVAGELIYLNKYSESIRILKDYLEEFQKIGLSRLILSWIARMKKRELPMERPQKQRLLILESQLYLFLKEFRQSLDCLKQLKNSEIEDLQTRRDYKFMMGNSLLGIQKYQNSLMYLQTALAMDLEMDASAVCLGDDYQSIAWIWDRKEEWEKAAKYYFKSYRYYIKGKNLYKQSQVISNLAINYFMTGKLGNVIKMYHKAIRLAVSLNDKYSESKFYYNMSIIYFYIGELYHSIKFLNLTMKLEQELGNRYELTFTYLTLGYIYIALDKEKIAEKYLLMGENLVFRSGSVYEDLAFTFYIYMSDCLISSGNVAGAKGFRLKALKYDRIIRGDRLYEYYELNNSARIAFTSKKYPKALRELKKILETLPSISDYYLLKTRFHIICTLLYMKKDEEASEMLEGMMDEVIYKNYQFWEARTLFPVYLLGIGTSFNDRTRKYFELILTELGRAQIDYFIETHRELFERSGWLSDTLAALSMMEFKQRYLVKTPFETYIFNEQDLDDFDESSREYDLWLDFVRERYYSKAFGEVSLVRGTKMYTLLKFFIRNSGVYFLLEDIYQKVWGGQKGQITSSDLGTVKVTISRLKKAIEPFRDRATYIESRKTPEGMSYRFRSDSSYCALINM